MIRDRTHTWLWCLHTYISWSHTFDCSSCNILALQELVHYVCECVTRDSKIQRQWNDAQACSVVPGTQFMTSADLVLQSR